MALVLRVDNKGEGGVLALLGLFSWRDDLFRWMQKNATPAAEYFNLPPDRVIELGTQLAL